MLSNTFKKSILEHFSCQQCGKCCQQEGYVYITDSECIKLANYLQLSIKEFKNKYIQQKNDLNLLSSPFHNQKCFLNDKNNCDIYPVRPKTCHTYPNWNYIWQTSQSLKLELKTCPALQKAHYQATKTLPQL